MQTKTDHERAALCRALEVYKDGDNDLIVVKDLNVEVKAPDASGFLPVVASTEDKDRDGDVIMAKGWDLKHFKRNPVIMWAHDYSLLPIGKAHNTRKEDGRLISEMEFTPHDVNPLGDTVRRMYEQGFLNAVSVGFKPIKFEPLADGSDDLFGGIKFLKQSLLEYSAVPIPSNPHALTGAKSAGIDMAPIKQWTEMILDGESPARMWVPRSAAEEMRRAVSTGRVFGLHHVEPREEIEAVEGKAGDVTVINIDATTVNDDDEAKSALADHLSSIEWAAEERTTTTDQIIEDLKAEIARLKGEGGDEEENTEADHDASTEDGEPPATDDVPQPEEEKAPDVLDIVRDGIAQFKEEIKQRDPMYGVALRLHAALSGEENANDAAAPQKGEGQQ